MRERQCKIVATIGPASSAPSMLRFLHEAGVDVFRLNFSHGDHERMSMVMDSIRLVEKSVDRPIAVFADLQGPKIRTGVLDGDGIDLKYGETYRLRLAKEATAPDEIPVPHPEVMDVLQPGDILKLDDGKLQITVKDRDGDTVLAIADTPGRLTNRKGINLPGRQLPISALTQKDREDLAYALSIGVDYIALSFVQRPEDLEEARELIAGRAKIISKIEKPSAVDHLDRIVELSDALMVARGDLGV